MGFAKEFLKETSTILIVHELALNQLKIGASDEDINPMNRCIKFIFENVMRNHDFVYPPVIPKNGDTILSKNEKFYNILEKIGIKGVH